MRSRRRWQPSPLIRAVIGLHLLAVPLLLTLPGLWPWIVGAIVLSHLVIVACGLWPRSSALGENWTRLPASAGQRIALTLDDGPDPEVTPQVLDILERHGVRATFFCIGRKVEAHPELARDIVRRGHTIENHSNCHSHRFSFSGLGGFTREIEAAQRTIAAVTGRAPQFFRAPAGLRNPLLDPVLHKLGLRLASWTCRGFDTRMSDAGWVKQRLLARLAPGAILLLHDSNCARTPAGVPVVVAVLPDILEAIRERGLIAISLAEAIMNNPSSSLSSPGPA